jgi:uncharacterized RDD family membrane protein YckC
MSKSRKSRKSPAYSPAPLGRRLAALVVDGFVMGLPIAMVGGLVMTATSKAIILNAVALAMLVIYETVALARYGTTIGKKALHIRISPDPESMTRPTVVQAALRVGTRYLLPVSLLSLVFEPAWFVLFAWAIYLLFTVMKDPDRRGLHDNVAGTSVVVIPK